MALALRQIQTQNAPSADLTNVVNAACTALGITPDGIYLQSASMFVADGVAARNSNGFYVVKEIQTAASEGAFKAVNPTNVTAAEFKKASAKVKKAIAEKLAAKFDAALRDRFMLPAAKDSSEVIVQKLQQALTL